MFRVLCVRSAVTDGTVSDGVFPEAAASFTSIRFM